MNMKNQRHKLAFVTGAPSGIGQASAELLAKAGDSGCGTSRRGADANGRSFNMLPLAATLGVNPS